MKVTSAVTKQSRSNRKSLREDVTPCMYIYQCLCLYFYVDREVVNI